MKKSVKNFSLVMGMAVAMQLSIACCPNFVNALDWKEGETYSLGTVVSYNGIDYKCINGHTAWAGTNWNPASTPALWESVGESNTSTWQEEETYDEEETWQEEETYDEEETWQEEETWTEEEDEISTQEPIQTGDITTWKEGETYNLGAVVTYNGKSYKCISGHTAWAGTNWNPESTPTLWESVDGTNTSTWQNEPTYTEEEPWNGGSTWQEEQETTNPVDLIESKGEWGEKVFAPYVDVLLYPYTDIDNLMNITGNKYYTLAFITSKSGTPAWGGVEDYNKNTTDSWEAVTHIRNGIKNVREAGGDVIVSFGGANGRELAMDITDVSQLQRAYQNVIDEYKLTWVDFDIEGFAVSDKASIQRRNQAIVGLQKANPDLTIAYCLPVMPEGLTADGLYILQDAKEKGVKIDVVNIMTMDYGPGYSADMGDYAIEAAENTEKQIRNIGLNSKIGNTPMIGTNDVQVEKFMQEDAEQLLNWAKNKDSVRLLSMWSITRDKATGTGLYNYTMIPQNDYDFTNIFKEFNK